ncbi:MAG: hypothetical protein F4X48_05160 [Acidimicrobiia bacterium]|nr:hypothetical protein [Acidimicrobiia bacterium]MYC57955.1 hypothetical protein [Acidimicrobiia bacterium]MYI31096.1 hypothetical protein [Acidimicrobiia bacterium]
MSTLEMDVEAAFDLANAYIDAADELDLRRQRWTAVVSEVDYRLGPSHYQFEQALSSIAEQLRIDSNDISQRVQMILLGPEGLNLALWAIDVLRKSHEVWNGEHIVSQDDLERFVTRTDDLGAAARILLTNDNILTILDTAKHNKNYLADPIEGFQANKGDGRISLEDLDAFESKISAYTTLLPYLAVIDTAAQGDPSQADQFLSKADFEAITADISLPTHVRQAAATVIAHDAYHRKDGFGWDDTGFWTLETAGVLPVVGEIVDGTRALHALSQGDYQSALFFAARVVMPLGTGKTLNAARALVEMGRRRAFKEMQYFVLTESGEKAKKKVRKTLRNETGKKTKETFNNWQEKTPLGFESRLGPLQP